MSCADVVITSSRASIWVLSSSPTTTRVFVPFFFFFQAEDGIRDLVRSRGLGDVYKRQPGAAPTAPEIAHLAGRQRSAGAAIQTGLTSLTDACLLYTSDAADERSSVDLGGRRIIKKKR